MFQKVTDMSAMFELAINTAPDVTLWDTSSLTIVVGLFKDSAADPDLSGWNFSNVAGGFGSMLDDNPISNENYSKFLIKLNSDNPNISFKYLDVAQARYNLSASSARANLISNGWTIIDAGPE